MAHLGSRNHKCIIQIRVLFLVFLIFFCIPKSKGFYQVAERQGKYLAKLLNRIGKAGGGHANAAKEMDFGAPFVYRHLGSMATVGRYKALVDLRKSKVISVVYFLQLLKPVRSDLFSNLVIFCNRRKRVYH